MSRSTQQIAAQQAWAGALNPPPDDDIEKARMRAALEAIRLVVQEAHRGQAFALTRIDQLARQGLAP